MFNKLKKPAIVLFSFVFYLGITFLLRPYLGNMTQVFLVVPVVVTAWLYGTLLGTLTGVIFALSNYVFLYYFGSTAPDQVFFRSIVGGIAIILIGFIIGYSRETSGKLGELREQSEILKLGINKSNDVIFITDIEGIIRYANPAFSKTYGYTEAEWKGKTPRILKSGYQNKKFYQEYWTKIKSGQNVQIVLRNKTKDGNILAIEASVSPIVASNKSIKGFLAIQRDITEKERIDRELKTRTDELEKLNKLMVGRELKMIEMKEKIKKLGES